MRSSLPRNAGHCANSRVNLLYRITLIELWCICDACREVTGLSGRRFCSVDSYRNPRRWVFSFTNFTATQLYCSWFHTVCILSKFVGFCKSGVADFIEWMKDKCFIIYCTWNVSPNICSVMIRSKIDSLPIRCSMNHFTKVVLMQLWVYLFSFHTANVPSLLAFGYTKYANVQECMSVGKWKKFNCYDMTQFFWKTFTDKFMWAQ